MGDDIGSGLSSMAVCFDFRSTNVVQLSNRNPYLMSSPINNPAYLNQLHPKFLKAKINLMKLFKISLEGYTSFLPQPAQN